MHFQLPLISLECLTCRTMWSLVDPGENPAVRDLLTTKIDRGAKEEF